MYPDHLPSFAMPKSGSLRALWQAFLVVVLGSTLTVAGTAPARAADITGSLSNVEATITGGTGTIGWGTQYDLTFDACVPDSAVTGDSWTVGPPSQLSYLQSSTPTINNPADPLDPWIEVHLTGKVATYTLTASGAAQSNLCFTSQMGGFAPLRT